MSKKYYTGAKFKNNQGSELTLLKKAEGYNGYGNTRYWHVRFQTGYECLAKEINIHHGKVSDRYFPTVYKVGYIGSSMRIPTSESGSIIRKHYDLWANMMKRCYGKDGSAMYTCYEDVTVDKPWHSFTVFNQEVVSLPGYDDWVSKEGYALDKDASGTRVYSKATCAFITAAENTRLACRKRQDNR